MAVQANISWDTIAPFFVWQFLIPLAAGWVQAILYAIFIRAGDPKPQPGSARFVRHRRQLLMVLYVAYFAFVVYEVDYELQRRGNAYADLGVAIGVDDSAINSRFRKLTVRFHPDKAGAAADRDRANDYYVQLKHARDMMLDPAKRFAYDRFGPAVLQQCSHCLTVGDYVHHALLSVLYTYGALLVFLLGANALGYLTDGAYWRYLALLAMATYEARTAMRPDHAPLLAQFINPILLAVPGHRPAYLPFQATVVMRKAALSAAQFLGLLVPLWRDDPQRPAKAVDDTTDARHKQLDRLEHAVAQSSGLAVRLVDLESTPYRQNDRAKSELRDALKKYMMQNTIHMDRDVRNAMGQSYARRRAGVPHGAQGNK